MATLALYVRQALLVAYILLGVLLGPSVGGLVNDAEMVREIAHIGIMFLLFLMGLELDPRRLLLMLRKAVPVALVSSLLWPIWVGAHNQGPKSRKKMRRRFYDEMMRLVLFGSLVPERHADLIQKFGDRAGPDSGGE